MEEENDRAGVLRTLSLPNEEELRERKSLVIKDLPSWQQTKLNRFLADPLTREPFLLFLNYFDICDPGYCDPVNRLGEVLDLVSEEKDPGENTRLSFFTPEIFGLYIPKKTSEFTEAYRQLGVYKCLKTTFPLLRGLKQREFEEVCYFVRDNLSILKSGGVITHFLKWYEILDPHDRLLTLTQMLTKFKNWMPYANCPFSSDELLYKRLLKIKSPFIRELILLHIITNVSEVDFHKINADYIDMVIYQLSPNIRG